MKTLLISVVAIYAVINPMKVEGIVRQVEIQLPDTAPIPTPRPNIEECDL